MEYQIVKYNTPNELIEKQWQVSNKVYNALEEHQRRSHDRNRSISSYYVSYREVERNVVLCCKNCGADFYGEFKFSDPFTAYQVAEQAEKQWDTAKRKYDSDLQEVTERENTHKLAREVEQLAHKDAENAKCLYKQVIESLCPVCGAKLRQERGFFLPDIDWFEEDNEFSGRVRDEVEQRFGDGYITYDSYERKLKKLSSIRENAERKQANEDVRTYVESCDLFTANVSANVAEVKTSNEALKQYILHLIQLENNIYSLEQQLPELYYRRLCNNRAVTLETHEPIYRIKTQAVELQVAYQQALEEISAADAYQPDISVEYPDEPAAPTLGKPGLFNKKKVLEENEMLTAKYQAEMDAYRKEVQRCDDEKARLIEEKRTAVLAEAQTKADAAKAALDEAERSIDDKMKALEARPVPAKAAKEILDKEIVEAEELLKKTFAARNELYAYDIIFGKYRDVVALSSFYEYLMSGRCTSLEGADGAYNIYENEIRLNRVISKLDTVIASLEDIKQNQYMMYQEMRNINASLQRLNSTMDKALTSIQGIEANTTSMNEYMEHISKNSDVIAHNTAVTAYYSKVNAELTNALGYMVAFK